MDSTPSNGDGVRARSRKANTSPTHAPNEGNGAVRRSGATAAGKRPARATMPAWQPAAVALPPFETYPAIVIENVQPELNGGRWPIKRVTGDTVEVSADIFKEGHDLLQARVIFHPIGESAWSERPMRFVDNDRWAGRFSVDRNTRYVYSVLAFTDTFGSWRADLQKRLAAGQEVSSELLEGVRLVDEAAARQTVGAWRATRNAGARRAAAKPPSLRSPKSLAKSWTAGPIAPTRLDTVTSCR
jgi:hypothetical protein